MGLLNFARTVLLPMFISAILYLVIFHALLPLYRQHRARYSQYLPLQSSSASHFLPESLRPSSLRDRLSTLFLHLFLPSTWAIRNRFSRGSREGAVVDAGAELFDDESGEAMVGFDVQERSRRRDGMERQLANMDAATRTVGRSTTTADSNPRLSRDLEEGFRDDSDDDDDEAAGETQHVVAGRDSSRTARGRA